MHLSSWFHSVNSRGFSYFCRNAWQNVSTLKTEFKTTILEATSKLFYITLLILNTQTVPVNIHLAK